VTSVPVNPLRVRARVRAWLINGIRCHQMSPVIAVNWNATKVAFFVDDRGSVKYILHIMRRGPGGYTE